VLPDSAVVQLICDLLDPEEFSYATPELVQEVFDVYATITPPPNLTISATAIADVETAVFNNCSPQFEYLHVPQIIYELRNAGWTIQAP